jgi:hypothetical protein
MAVKASLFAVKSVSHFNSTTALAPSLADP